MRDLFSIFFVGGQFGFKGSGQPQVVPDEMWTLWFDLFEANELPVSGFGAALHLLEAEVVVSIGPHKISSSRDTIKVKHFVTSMTTGGVLFTQTKWPSICL